jgi:hypothetical protein
MSIEATSSVRTQPICEVDVTNRESIHNATDKRIQECVDNIRVWQSQYNDMPNCINGVLGTAATGAALIYSGELKWGTTLLLAGLVLTFFFIQHKNKLPGQIEKTQIGITNLERLKANLSTPAQIQQFAKHIQANKGTTTLEYNPFYLAFRDYARRTV